VKIENCTPGTKVIVKDSSRYFSGQVGVIVGLGGPHDSGVVVRITSGFYPCETRFYACELKRVKS
jgi:hypothetical protein